MDGSYCCLIEALLQNPEGLRKRKNISHYSLCPSRISNRALPDRYCYVNPLAESIFDDVINSLIVPLFWTSALDRDGVASFTPWPLYCRGNRPWYSLYRRLGGFQSRCGRYGEKKKILNAAGNRTRPSGW
jgi:hypothetical protein